MDISDKLHAIYLGWQKLLFRDDTVEKIAIKRAEKCAKCSESVFLVGDLYNHCRKCKCYLPAKVRSLDKSNKCPLGKW